MKDIPKVNWLTQPHEDNYKAASSYLNLIFDTTFVEKAITALKEKPISSFMAKDIFRASGLPLLGISNVYIKKNKKKLRAGEAISPILLLKDESSRKVIVADGYHRMCALYYFHEEVWVHCKIV